MKKEEKKVLKYELEYDLVKSIYHIISEQAFKGEASVLVGQQIYRALNNPINIKDMMKWIEEEKKANEAKEK